VSPMASESRSVRKFLLCVAGPTLWAIYLFTLYGASTLVCGRPADPAGDPFPTITALATALAMAGLLALMGQSSWRRKRGGEEGGTEASSFLARASVTLAALAALAVIWLALAAAIVPPCRA
jgi:hypothetical protein